MKSYTEYEALLFVDDNLEASVSSTDYKKVELEGFRYFEQYQEEGDCRIEFWQRTLLKTKEGSKC